MHNTNGFIATAIKYLSITLLLAGCVSIDDFKEMGSVERAEQVCQNSKAYHKRQQGHEAFYKASNEFFELANKGYKLVETCEEVMVPSGVSICVDRPKSTTPATTTATASAPVTVCTESKIQEKQCRQTPVSIDAKQATADGDLFLAEAMRLREEHQELTDECVVRVMKLTPEAAYRLYQSGRDGAR